MKETLPQKKNISIFIGLMLATSALLAGCIKTQRSITIDNQEPSVYMLRDKVLDFTETVCNSAKGPGTIPIEIDDHRIPYDPECNALPQTIHIVSDRGELEDTLLPIAGEVTQSILNDANTGTGFTLTTPYGVPETMHSFVIVGSQHDDQVVTTTLVEALNGALLRGDNQPEHNLATDATSNLIAQIPLLYGRTNGNCTEVANLIVKGKVVTTNHTSSFADNSDSRAFVKDICIAVTQ